MMSMKTSNGNTKTFNLIDCPWIPVIDRHGTQKLVSLREFYEKANTLGEIIGTPPQHIAVMRLLICISQAALQGPTNNDEWLQAKERIVPESLTYLEKWHNRFDLFGEFPFLQVPNLKPKSKIQKVDKLDLSLASGNNNTVFDQTADENGRIHSPEKAILHLLVSQSFSPEGTLSIASHGKDVTPGKSASASPCNYKMPLYTILYAENLHDTLWMNIIPISPDNLGLPMWECDIQAQLTNGESLLKFLRWRVL